MNPNELFYSKIFVDGAKCEWMKICLVGKPGVSSQKFYCNDGDMVYVYIRNGFVVMPGALNGAPIRFVKSTKTTAATDMLQYRPTQIGFDKDKERFSIWSVGRERVISTTNMNHDGNLIVYFSHHNCLLRGYGIAALGVGTVYEIDPKEKIDTVSVGTGEKFTYGTVETRQTLGTAATERPTPNASAVAPVTTTPEVRMASVIGTGYGGAPKEPRTGWVIMMMFGGFLIGSMLALIIAGGLLYFARRTVYTDW
ncbi:hypothetical protein Aduo_002848 [Ancylostoma duodenale]